MKTDWYNRKGWVILIHTGLWVALYCLPFLIHPQRESKPAEEQDSARQITAYILGNLLWVLFFYLNALRLVPAFFSRNRPANYVFALLSCFIVLVGLQGLVFNYLCNGQPFSLLRHIIFNFLLFLFYLASSIAYRLIADKTRADVLARDKENENLKTELSLLRSQASPHFLFNVLNNMVALARKKSDLLEPSLIKLSSLIRYTVYDTLEETVILEKEVDYLRSYIDLQQQRFGNNVAFHINFKTDDTGLRIEPMLLIPFVENAIKHGTGFIENAEINIELRTTENQLFFFVANRYDTNGVEQKDATHGIGLTNVKRRLSLLYPRSHRLDISKNDGWFSVTLELTLH